MTGRVPGLASVPEWIAERSSFWYRVGTTAGWRFVVVDAADGSRTDAFDHDRLAGSILKVTGESQDPDRLEIEQLSWPAPQLLQFRLGEDRWRCDLSSYACTRLAGDEQSGVRSPDGSLLAFSRGSDLCVRTVATGQERRLTDDGTEKAAYGRPLPSPLRAAGLPMAGQPGTDAAVLWSPDGRRLLTHRMHTDGAGELTMTLAAPLDGSIRPRSVSYLYPLPGDEIVPRAELIIVDLATGTLTPVDIEPLEQLYYGSPIPPASDAREGRSIWWDPAGSRCYLLRKFRGNCRLALYEVDASSGSARILVDETDETPVDANITVSGRPNVRVLESSQSVLWYSQRDGWGHLYLYDASSGELLRQLTTGQWAVADVHHVDEAAGLVYFSAYGRIAGDDQYCRRLFRVPLAGGEPELLTPQDGSHLISFAPDGASFTTTWSRIDTAPQLQLCRSDGTVQATLETAQFGALLEIGWRFPERFAARARDGQTAIGGILIFPTDFDPSHRYPVVDAIYGGPQTNQAPTVFAEIGKDHPYWQAQAIAELGFIVVMIDGLGMPYRSKAFRDVAYRNLADAGLPDHVQAIRELAAERHYLDDGRVGIYGHSAGGYASCQAILAHPEFYKVCVSSAGNHDHRLDKAWWVERYMGWPIGDHYEAQANRTIAHQLQGKLLLIHGEADENVPVAATMSLADALIRADKDFDLLILANRPHACGADPYVIRRRWDHFVRHLAGVEPPDYLLTT